MDTTIAIRTAVVAAGRLHVQAGAGVVYDSDPHSEWLETLVKARAVFKATELAERGVDRISGDVQTGNQSDNEAVQDAGGAA